MFQNLSQLKNLGYSGFLTVNQVRLNYDLLPNNKGTYLILKNESDNYQFLPKGTGGYFKGKDPNVDIQTLKDNWVENTVLLYAGKAGGNESASSIKKRVKQYLEFGQGKAIGHYGGRYIWQLSNNQNLLLAWKVAIDRDPREEEKLLLRNFYDEYGVLPFANLVF